MTFKSSHTQHFATLDGLRGIAAITVLFYHVCQLSQLAISLPHAYLAVDFFFMLSGFVVANAYEVRLRASMSFLDFVKVRLVRLYPMIFAGVVLGAITLIARFFIVHDLTLTQVSVAISCALLLVPTTAASSVHPDLYPVDGPEWSLFFEIAINFAYAFLLKWLSTLRLIIICILSGLALCLVALFNHNLHVGMLPDNFLYGFVRVTFSFLTGVFLWRVYKKRRRLPGGGGSTGISCLLLLTVLLFPFFEANTVYELIVIMLVFPFIIIFGAACKNGPVVKNICQWLGGISYPLYITHHPLIRIISNIIKHSGFRVPAIVIISIYLAVTFLVAVVLLTMWDKPMRRMLSNKFHM